MKRLTVLCPVSEAQRLLRTLHSLGVVQISDAREREESVKELLQRPDVSTEDCDQALQRVNLILGLIDTHAPERKGFVAGLATVPLVIEPKELDDALRDFALEQHYKRAHELDAACRHAERVVSEAQNKLKDLEPHRDLPFSVGDLGRTRYTRFLFGKMEPQALRALESDPETPRTMTWERVVAGVYYRKGAHPPTETSKPNEPAQVLVCFTQDVEDRAREALNGHGFEEVGLPPVSGKVRDRIRELQADAAAAEGQIAEVRAGAQQIAQHRRTLLVLKAFWESCRNLALARLNCAKGRWIQIVTGYVREADVPAVDAALKTLQGTTLLIEDPAPDEPVPVHLSLPDVIRPIQMLVNLFGLPSYATFDPSPFIVFSFLIFFGICFSDVAYGSMLVLLSLYIMYRTRLYPGVYNFARLLFYAGLSTVVFGFLLGSWFGDLYKPEYLGENNFVQRVMQTTQVIDPLQKPIVVLLAALAIGMLNQFYGIALKMYSALLRGDKKAAVFDGLLWLIILPGFVVLVSSVFVPMPSLVFRAGLVLFAIGAIGLILTQGRDQKNIVARLLTGVISLYGIVGSYGLTAFIGDTMSYCRLLALALTTSIVALSFNMMAGLLRPIPYVGIFLFVGVLIIAHIFNFLISVLGAFVHSMRLIFVEFFGRFYETGAKPFTPLGFDSSSAILKKQR